MKKMKKYFLILILMISICGCDPVHRYVIYNNYYDNISFDIERTYNNQISSIKEDNIEFGKKAEQIFLGHSFSIKEEHLPSKIIIYYENKECFIYNKKWLISELKNNKLYGKSYLFLILGKNGLYAVSEKEYKKIIENNTGNGHKMTEKEIKNICYI